MAKRDSEVSYQAWFHKEADKDLVDFAEHAKKEFNWSNKDLIYYSLAALAEKYIPGFVDALPLRDQLAHRHAVSATDKLLVALDKLSDLLSQPITLERQQATVRVLQETREAIEMDAVNLGAINQFTTMNLDDLDIEDE